MHGLLNVKFSTCCGFSTSVLCAITKEPTTKRKNLKYFGHILGRNCLLYHIIVGNICVGLKVKVKWSRYRPGVDQRVGRGIALLFHDRGTRRGWVVSSTQQHTSAALYPRERPGTHFTGGWVGPRAGLDGRKTSFSPGFDPRPSSP